MTNDPFDPQEAPIWLKWRVEHPQFRAVLRLDKILRQWSANWQVLEGQGYKVECASFGKIRSRGPAFFSIGANACGPCTWPFRCRTLSYTHRKPSAIAS